MKSKIISFSLLVTFYSPPSNAQNKTIFGTDSLAGFNEEAVLAHLQQHHLSKDKIIYFLESEKKQFIRDKYYPAQSVSIENPILPAQSGCNNLDFENGTTQGWKLNQTTKLVSTGVDYYGGFPKSCPGGKYSLKIGADTLPLPGLDKIHSSAENTFKITCDNALITINYAMVFLNYTAHTKIDCAKTYFQVFDASNKLINCVSDTVFSLDTLFFGVYQGLKKSKRPRVTDWDNECCYNQLYKDWTKKYIDLRAYIGQTVTMKITAAWCKYNLDWSYCYIDCSCGPISVTANPTCNGTPFQVCVSPPGLKGSWTGPGGSGVTGDTTDCVTTTMAGSYTRSVQIQHQGTCPTTYITDTVEVGPKNAGFKISGNCLNISLIDTTPPPHAKSSSPCSDTTSSVKVLSRQWDFGDRTPKETIPNPNHTYTDTGTFKIRLILKTSLGCDDTITKTITLGKPAMSIKKTDIKCYGDKTGKAAVSVSGTFSDYTFSWTPSGGTDTIATGLGADTYSCKIHSSCFDTILSVTITEPPALSHTKNSTPSTCGKTDGSASTTESGGTSPYTYSWNTGPTTPNLSTIKSGYYTLSIKDANGCKDTNFVFVPGGGAFTDTPATVDIKCFGGTDGSVSVTSTGGTTPYIYLWLPGGQNTSAITGLTAGSYTCVIKDQSVDCVDSVVVTIAQPAKLIVQPSSVNPVCHGDCSGSASVISSGATSPYTYSWANGSAIDSAKSLCAGTYTIHVRDKNNCTLDTSVLINDPPGMTFVKTATPTICGNSNGTASVTANGGTPGYIYYWNNGTTVSNISNVTAGIYTLEVEDSKGCKDSVKVAVLNSATFSISALPGTLKCFGDANGSLSVSVNGTSSPYKYSWSNGETVNPISNLSAGIYSINVTDKDGCFGTITDTLSQPAPLIIQTSGKTICSGESTTLTINTTGGTLPYSYLWNNVAGGTSSVVTPATTSVYTVTTTDANGCTVSINDSIIVKPGPIAAFSGIDVCIGIPTMFKDSSFVTNRDINSWVWNFGDGTSSANQNPVYTYTKAGTYTVSLTVSAGNCNSTITHVVHVYTVPHADFSADPQPSTVLNPTITFTDLSVGGTNGSWNLGDGTTDVYALGVNPVHTYPNENTPGGESFRVHLNIINQYGCPDTISKIIHIDPEWTFFVPNTFTPNGDGKNDLFFGTGIGIIEKEMWIFDRWGNLIFHTNDLYGGWDGKVQGGASNEVAQEDTYVWLIMFKEVFLKTHRLIGHVNIIK